MRSSEILKVLGINSVAAARLRAHAGITQPIGSGNRHAFSPGDVLAMYVVNEIDGPGSGTESKWAEGARKCGEALDNGYHPAYLVTRGGSENVVVIESESPAATDEMVAALLMQASDAGAAVKVVRLRRFLRRLEPWMRELTSA